jgi:hypothetical protein
MGEMADELIDHILDYEIHNEDALATCRYCGAHGYWVPEETGWRIIEEDGDLHTCEAYRKIHEKPNPAQALFDKLKQSQEDSK